MHPHVQCFSIHSLFVRHTCSYEYDQHTNSFVYQSYYHEKIAVDVIHQQNHETCLPIHVNVFKNFI